MGHLKPGTTGRAILPGPPSFLRFEGNFYLVGSHFEIALPFFCQKLRPRLCWKGLCEEKPDGRVACQDGFSEGVRKGTAI